MAAGGLRRRAGDRHAALGASLVLAVAAACAGSAAAQDPVAQQLDGYWKKAASDFGNTLAGSGVQFYGSVQSGQRGTGHGGSTPPVTNNFTFDPNQHLAVTAVSGYEQLTAVNTICQAYTKAIVAGVLEGSETGSVSTLFRDGLDKPFASFVSFIKQYEGAMVIIAGEGGTMEGGGGLGFGAVVRDCNGDDVLNVNGAIAWGFHTKSVSTSIFPDIASGITGGASITMVNRGGGGEGAAINTVLAVGGGGGGNLSATNGVYTPRTSATVDDGQIVGHGGDLDAIFSDAHSNACTPLSLHGSGGGGGGFQTIGGNDPLHYGASAGFTYSFDGATGQWSSDVSASSRLRRGDEARAAAAGGAAAHATRAGARRMGDSGGDDGGAIGEVIAECRTKCLAGSGVPGGAFYACFCPCLKQGVAAQKLPWPHQIQCSQ